MTYDPEATIRVKVRRPGTVDNEPRRIVRNLERKAQQHGVKAAINVWPTANRNKGTEDNDHV